MRLTLIIILTLLNCAFSKAATSICFDVYKPFVFQGNFENPAMHFNGTISDHMLLTPNKSLLGSSKFTKRTQDLSGLNDTHLAKNIGKAWEESDFYYKFNTIKDFDISKIIAAPGHSTLRSVDNIKKLSKFINQKGGNHFGNDKLILNIITDSQKNILNIDGWNGHHRLVAYLEAGKKRISDIGDHNLTILVNGNFEAWNKWPHIVPAHGIDVKKFKPWSKIVGSDDAYAVSVDGALSNYAMGSRQTVNQVYKNVMRTDQSKIGIIYIKPDDAPENIIKYAKQQLDKNGLDEVVFVPILKGVDNSSITKSFSELSNKLKDENKINLLINDQRAHIDSFDSGVIVKYIENLYASKKVSIINP
jgi:hypothetical protein